MSNSKPPPPTYDEVNRPNNVPSAPPSYEDTLDQITADLASNQLYDRPPEVDELPEKVPIPDSDPDVGPSTSRASAPPRPKIRPGSLFPDRNLRKVAGEEEQLPREPSDIEKKVVYTDPDLKAKVTPFNPPRSLAWMLDQDVPPQSVTVSLESRFCTRCDGWHSGRCRSRSCDQPSTSIWVPDPCDTHYHHRHHHVHWEDLGRHHHQSVFLFIFNFDGYSEITQLHRIG
ncbi:hypothetical protein WR25_23756 isoform E [Diploscapter pachys]|uniref:Uncharacterized protein n=1 Tax=Diploscapter pachys TaxID=2018661 RepID=A0A2A2JFN7_9BILA|nr:hypothetical protein WR25_23756 isoform A [Diploscapter pachys]PAV60425.1 hypothetical protein WR25_23756 isoform E [Diploscapter pachys]